ncbi:high-affinity iron transporter [Nocardioides albertanoniae]|uniref:High-affinity iron transporter n=1 Tax=Nocardioides albertanoniae TaxID=1175486 RepID=A0A543AAE2_9ACTN|nr:iron uptake transporter permease EfeU [Nocardioides albertanoniae]TQL69509.1 high-affinity iron transporter [Nocardioides albertanoniae]
MLPTFVIGLREGLEAALIVSIIATFLRRNGAPLRGLWVGVGAGIGLSIAVGVALRLLEQALPQRQQEMLECVIGVIAIVFVTGMIRWMHTHARTLKGDLEQAAAAALSAGTMTAMAVMGFLAVLREGFETSVFLLATIQNATSAPAAILGALLGLAIAIGLGWGIFAGGLRLNLKTFFQVTGVFLVFVAAGLVMFALRTGHEAGWVTVGQAHTVDLSWLIPNGSVRSAVITGILGIPADPRVIEVLGWLAYLVPMLAMLLLPATARPGARLARRLRLGGAIAALAVAAALFALVPLPEVEVPARAPLADGRTAELSVDGRSASLSVGEDRIELGDPTGHAGNADTAWHATGAGALPGSLTAADLLTYTGDRVPVGLDLTTAPGPYETRWTDTTRATVLTRDDGLVDVRSTGRLLLTIEGGGLTSPRTFTVDPALQIDAAYASGLADKIRSADATAHDRLLWKRWVPVALILLAGLLLWQSLRRPGRGNDPRALNDPAREVRQESSVKGSTHVA